MHIKLVILTSAINHTSSYVINTHRLNTREKTASNEILKTLKVCNKIRSN